ncbi:Eif4e1b [Symbiodinium microadriaticum]|nr:Eif4e1b [Symbiodinium microadriaticum]
MGKSKGKLDALLLEAAGVELDPKKVLKMEPEERASWLSTACRVASEGAVKVSQLYNVLASEKFADGLNEKVGKRMHRTMLKYLHIFSDKQQRYLKQCGLARDFGLNDKEAPNKEVADVKPRRKSQSDEDAAVRMEEMMARCRNFVREKAQTYEERMREAEEQEREARRQEMLRREREERERLAREWAEIADWHRQLEGWERSQLAIEDLREQERAREAQEVREALEGNKSRSRSKRKRPLEEDQPWPAEEQILEEELRRAQHGHDVRTPSVGRVVEWKKTHGWIEPDCPIDHPEIVKHQGHIFVHGEDLVPKWRNLVAGAMVEFFLYYDGQGLGAEECTARKVLRVTLSWKQAQAMFGETGERLADFEQKSQVTIRAYQWCQPDGGSSDLPFLLFEIWGRPQAVVDAIGALATLREEDGNGAEDTLCVNLLLPESRMWKVDLMQLQHYCSLEVSSSITITDPMPCRTLTIQAPLPNFRSSLHALIMQACD